MRKMYFLFVMAFFTITQSISAQPESPLNSTKVTGEVIIDGEGTDAVWSTAPWNDILVVFKGEEAGFTSSDDFAAKFKIADDVSKVYFLFDVTDDIVTQDENAHWAGDKVEIYFGLPGYNPSAGANGTSARQIAIKAQFDPTIAGESGSNNWPGSNNIDEDGVEYAYVETAAGYMLEVSIDKAIVLEDVPSKTPIAFDVSIADNDELGASAIRYRKSWYNDGEINELWANMEGAGELILQAGSSASTLVSIVASETPAIDGNGDDVAWTDAEWNNISVVFKGEESGFTGPDDFTGKFKVVDDASKVFFLLDITDDIVTIDPDAHWVGDKVEIYFGLPGYNPSAGANGTSARQIAIKAQFDPTVASESGSNNWPGSGDITTDGVEYSFVETTTGYMMEVSIDKAIVLENVPSNTAIAFDVSVADNDELGGSGVRYRQSYFNDGAINELWANMEGAGKIKFSAAPSVYNPDRYEAEKAKVSGATAEIRLSSPISGASNGGVVGGGDAGMNTTDDKVTFTVNAKNAGDYLVSFGYVTKYYGSSPRQFSIDVNGTFIKDVDYTPEVAENVYTTTPKTKVSLNAGQNEIVFYLKDGNKGWMFLDYVDVKDAYPTKYEAEEASLSGVSAVAQSPSPVPGASNDAVVGVGNDGMTNDGDKVSFVVNVKSAGKYSITFMYAPKWYETSPRQFSIDVNGAFVADVDYTPTAGANVFSKTPALMVDLKEGENVIDYYLKNGGKGWMFLDFMEVKDPYPTKYEAEEATLSGVSAVAQSPSPISGASNDAVVGAGNDGMTNTDDKVSFTVTVKAAGNYQVKFVYAPKWYETSPRQFSLNVNGTFVADVDYTPSQGADVFSETPATSVTLAEGSNTIDYYLKDGGKGWMFLDYMMVDLATSAVNVQNNTSFNSAYIAHDILRFKGFSNAIDADIYTILGQKVLSAKNINEINVSSLKDGIYIVRVGQQSFKVIK